MRVEGVRTSDFRMLINPQKSIFVKMLVKNMQGESEFQNKLLKTILKSFFIFYSYQVQRNSFICFSWIFIPLSFFAYLLNNLLLFRAFILVWTASLFKKVFSSFILIRSVSNINFFSTHIRLLMGTKKNFLSVLL